MKRLATLLLALMVAPLSGLTANSTKSSSEPFTYTLEIEDSFVELVTAERASAAAAARDGEAELWALTLSLVLEMAHAADDPAERGFALDAVLHELTHNRAWALLRRTPDHRVRALRGSLLRFNVDDPAELRAEARRLARARLRVLEARVMEGGPHLAQLDALLRRAGWGAAGEAGPKGRQRAQDRDDFRIVDRHDVAMIEGMARRHMFLPPTEAWEGAELADIERKIRRSRNFVRRIDDLWTHQDGPRVHDFILDLALRDGTGIVRLVHADTTLLAQHDRMRRWRLREALWRLGSAG